MTLLSTARNSWGFPVPPIAGQALLFLRGWRRPRYRTDYDFTT